MISPRSPIGTRHLPFEAIEEITLSTQAIESWVEFQSYCDHWRLLQESMGALSPGRSWEWLSAWWDTFGEVCPRTQRVGQPYIVIVCHLADVMGIFPYVIHAPAKWDLLSPRRLRQMGSAGEFEPSGLTEEPLVAVRKGYEDQVRKALLAHLSKTLKIRNWDSVISRSPRYFEPKTKPSLQGGLLQIYKIQEGPERVTLPDTWALYRKQMTKSMRDNLSYYPKLLSRTGLSYKVRSTVDDLNMNEAFETLIRLHKRRASKNHADYFRHSWQREMLKNVFHHLAPIHRAFIATLEVDGAVVAAQAFFESNGELLVHYAGFEPSFAKYSPLLVLQESVFRSSISERGTRFLNLLYGGAPWQRRWTSHPAELDARMILVNLRPMAVLRTVFYVVASKVDALVNRVRSGFEVQS